MIKLRKFLCFCFGSLALLFLFVSFGILPFLLSISQEFAFNDTMSRTTIEKIILIFATAVACLILLSPLLVTFLNGMAWWTIKQGKASARGWSIAASMSLIVSGSLISFPGFYSWSYNQTGFFRELLVISGVIMALGIAGLVAFGRRDSMAQPVIAAQPPRITGDGTGRLLDGIAWLIVIAGYFEGMHLWRLWGNAHGFLMSDGLLPIILILIAILISIASHEFGHAIAGLALGMKLCVFIIGPFQWRIRDGRWKFQFLPAKFFSAGGATALVPTNPLQSQWRDIFMIAAGPLMSLLTGLIALIAALTAKGMPYENVWELLALVTTVSLMMFVRNLIPSQLNAQHMASYSDGAQIYQLLRGGSWADLHRVLNLVASSAVTPLRPRDFGIESIQQASLSFTQGRYALLLRLFASYYFLDCGKISHANEEIAGAERIYLESAADIPAELHTDFIFSKAILSRDAAGARQWWDRMEAKKPTHLGVDYWLARSALSWIEGRKDDARAAWEKANLLAQKLPVAGIYDFDRYRCSLLHDCIENEGAKAMS